MRFKFFQVFPGVEMGILCNRRGNVGKPFHYCEGNASSSAPHQQWDSAETALNGAYGFMPKGQWKIRKKKTETASYTHTSFQPVVS